MDNFRKNTVAINGEGLHQSQPLINDTVEKCEIAQEPHIAKKKNTSFILYFTAAMAALGCSMPGGYNMSVLNAPQQILVNFTNGSLLSKYELSLGEVQLNLIWSVVVSVFLIGGIIGSLTTAFFCNKLGRKWALEYVNVIGLVSAILFYSAKSANSVELLFFGRLLAGYFAGFTAGAVPMYVMEVAPPSMRGSFGTMHACCLNLGVLSAQVLGLSSLLGTEETWQYLLSFYALPIVLCGIALIFCPESPTFLYIVKNKPTQAMEALSRLRNRSVNDLQDDLVELKRDQKVFMSSSSWNARKLLETADLRTSLLIVCLLHICQQLSGINAVMYYSTSIFMSAGLDLDASQYATIGCGLVNFLMTVVSVGLLSFCRRRCLFMSSAAASCLCLVVMTVCLTFIDVASFLSVVGVGSLIMYVVCYAFGLGPIPFIFGSELFPPGPRPTAMSLGVLSNFTSNFIVALAFPTLQSTFGHYTFLIFIGFLIVLTEILRRIMPETKKDSAQLQQQNSPKHVEMSEKGSYTRRDEANA